MVIKNENERNRKEKRMIQDEIFRAVIAGLFGLMIVLLGMMFYRALFGMARVYNWNGKRYCYLGWQKIRRENGDFALRIGERMLDLSYTTTYRICPGRAFCRKNRYRNLFVYADGGRGHLVIDREPMKTEIPF